MTALSTENTTQTVIHRRLQLNVFEISQVLKGFELYLADSATTYV